MLQESQANQPAGDTGGYSKHSFPVPRNLSVPAGGGTHVDENRRGMKEKLGTKPLFKEKCLSG